MLKTTRVATVQSILNEELNYKLGSLTPVEGIEINKNYRINPLVWMKFNKNKITAEELKKEYYRQLDARGKHLIEGDLRDYVLVCDCENKVHRGDCSVKLMRDYLKIKEDICTADDIKKRDFLAEYNEAVVDDKCPKCSTVLEADDDTGMYCAKCDDVFSFDELES